MFGSVVLNVVIGLILIYLLYSLLVTILGEIISSWLGIRAHVLKKSIERMLNDTPVQSASLNSWDRFLFWLRHFLMLEGINFKHSLADRFYKYPLIKYLSDVNHNGPKQLIREKPSYISRDAFTQALIHIFRSKGTGSSDIDKVTFCITHNTLFMGPQTRIYLENLLRDAAGDIDAFSANLGKWFDETMDRANGWYKRKQRLIMLPLSFLLAVSFNVDSIKISRILAKDPEARNKLADMGVALAKDSNGFGAMIEKSKDTSWSKTFTDSAYQIVKKDIDDANLILGLGWEFPQLTTRGDCCMDTTNEQYSLAYRCAKQVLQYSAKQKNFEQQYIFNQTRYAGLLELQGKVDSIKTELKFLYGASYNTLPDSVLQTYIPADYDTTKLPLIAQWKKLLEGYIRACRDSIDANLATVNSATGEKFVGIDSVTLSQAGFIVYGEMHRGRVMQYTANLLYVIWSTRPWQSAFWGFLITALALSLGAPFWFDLLKKMVALRSSGTKPEEKPENQNPLTSAPDKDSASQKRKKEDTANNSVAIPDPVDPVEIGLQIYGDTIAAEPGVVDVDTGYHLENDSVKKCLEVNVLDEETASRIRETYKNLAVGLEQTIDIHINITGKIKLVGNGNSEFILREKSIANRTLKNGYGTMGCVVQKNSQKYILSCYHVMNATQDWDNPNNERDIIDADGNIIANYYERRFSKQQDTAIAPVSDEIAEKILRRFANPIGSREIVEDDVLTTKVKLFCAASGPRKGFVSHCSKSVEVPYSSNGYFKDFPFKDTLRLKLDPTAAEKNGVVIGGDSGSIVLDEDNLAIGMVFAKDEKYTYAIKFTKIEEVLSITI